MKKTNVLVIGGGGREDALCWKLKKSPQAGIVYCAPGNPGTAMLGCQNIPLQPFEGNFQILAELACHLEIGLVVIQMDNALALGMASEFTRRGIPTFAPTASAARIESSKIFANAVMNVANIPKPHTRAFLNNQICEARDYARIKNGLVVVKADGLAQGKGAIVCRDLKSAMKAIEDFMVIGILDGAGRDIVMQDILEGQELSIHALSDGTNVKLFPPVRDHKRLVDGNQGPMTGGMGVYGPIDVSEGLMEQIEKEIVLPCIREIKKRGMPFIGCLYPGLMLTEDGPKVLEFNARFGDPETQVYMRLLEDDVDLIEVFLACIHGNLDNKINLRFRKEKCICIVAAASGYPENPTKGDIVKIDVRNDPNIYNPVVFHSGTAWSDGELVTNGGRVLGLTRLISTQSGYNFSYFAYEAMRNQIKFDGMQYRSDIGKV